MPEVASAYVSLMPSAKGFGSKLESEVGGDVKKSGGILGKALGSTMFKAVAGVAVGAAGVGKVLYGIGETFDDVSDTIRVGTGATGKNLASLEASAKRVGTSVPAAFADIGPVIADLNTRLGLTGKPLETLSKQFLEAGRITGEALNIKTVTAAFNAFGVTGERTSGALDKIYRISQATGVSMNDLASSVARNAPNLKQFGFSIGDSAALIGTLDKAGLDSNKTLATLSRAMVEFAKKGENPKKALRGTVNQIEKFTKSGKDAAAIKLASKIFGTRGASQFVAAIKSGKVNLNALQKSTGATSDTILKAGEDTADFAEAWLVFKNKALVAIEPVATRVFNALGNGMKSLDAGKVKNFVIAVGITGTALLLLNTAANVAAAGGIAKYLMGTKLVTTATKLWAGAQAILNAVLSANPIGLVIVGLTALGVGLVIAYKKSATFRAVVQGAFKGVRVAASWVVTAVAKVLSAFAGMLRAATHIPGIGDKFKGPARAMEDAARKARGLAADIRGIKSPPVIDIRYRYTMLGGKPGGLPKGVLAPPQRAMGGPVRAGSAYIVGENGPELFTARQSGRIVPNHKLAASASALGTPVPIVNVQVGDVDFEAYVTAIVDDRIGG